MAYFEDLTPYSYCRRLPAPDTLNVGWLSADHDFRKGPTSAEFQKNLTEFCSISVWQTRGCHGCEFCGARVPVIDGLSLGSAEIRVFGETCTFACPNLILHYVTAHAYQPPDEFIDAVLSSVCPPATEYFDRLTGTGFDWHRRMDEARKAGRQRIDSDGLGC
jgi:hypothetical protein